MAGYQRQDTNNNIANGNVIDADDFDNEFNAIEDAFNASTGHNHDGTPGGGATINSLGPSSDFVVNATEIKGKTPSTLSVGSSGVPFLDGHFDGTLNTDILSVDETSTFTGEITATGGVAGNVTGDLTGDVKNSDGTVVVNVGSDTVAAVLTGNVTGNLTGDVLNSDATTVLDVGTDVVTAVFTGNVTGNVTGNADSADAWSTSRTVTFATGDVTGSFSIDGSADVTDVDLSVASSLTTDLVGDVYASNGTSKILESGTDGSDAVLTGTVSSLSNHDTDNLSEGSTNLYYTDARVNTHLNIGTATSNQLLSWTGTDYDWIDAGASANYYLDGGSYDSGTGNLTLQVSGSSNITVGLQIPTSTNQLTNNSQFATTDQIPAAITNNDQLINGEGYATTSQLPTVPTQVSAFSNDSQYATTSQVPAAVTNNDQLTNGRGYATTSQVPQYTSQLQNNSGYITSATPSTSQVGSATAGLAHDAVGSYALLKASGGNPGGTITGSTNYFTNTEWSSGPTVSSSGTWKRMGFTGDAAPTVYLRIS